jgi:hypothetical protein
MLELRTARPSVMAAGLPPVKGAAGELAFVRAVLTHAIATGQHSARARKALGRLQDYERARLSGMPLERLPGAPGPRMRSALLRFFFRNEGLRLSDWVPLAKFEGNAVRALCFGCGTVARRLIARLRVGGACRRRIVVCPRCGVVEDAPIWSALRAAVNSRRRIWLQGRLPGQDWTAGLLLSSRRPADNRGLAWPARATGAPVTTFRVPGALPPGPLLCSVLLFWRESVTVLTLPIGTSAKPTLSALKRHRFPDAAQKSRQGLRL